MNPQPADGVRELEEKFRGWSEDNDLTFERQQAFACAADELSALLDQHAVAEPSEWNNLKPALLQLLKDACDRDWKDETPEQIIRIAANGLYWRDQQIEKLQETPDYKNGYAAGWAEAHAAEQPKENWEPVRSQYVWVEGKLTENQPETFPKKLRVYVHGVGTGIAENVRPVTEMAAEQPKLTKEQVRDAHAATLSESLDFQDSYFYRKLTERLNALLTSPVAPPPQQKEKP